ncbi:unnamed protein product [Rotaria sp. Silwood1]|nr:unnamed protein product [Rotaria sp. Silwood1]CAF1637457.1 unnamed protein product [Rotaria sp. Silwood1]CAF3797865.1 unnamed protein product [Rotaria sp. Silwood1]CAF4879889.1 unnamed protein product [Rotaria sp. Silwood1]
MSRNVILKTNRGSNNNSCSLTVNVPKRLGIYYRWPLLVQGANGNLTQAIHTFNDVMSESLMLLDSRNIYLLESYLISSGNYQNLTTWKIKADKCLSYSNSFRISMAFLSTNSTQISSSFDSTPQFSQA